MTVYVKKTWTNGVDVVDKTNLEHLETQYDDAVSAIATHAALLTGVHGLDITAAKILHVSNTLTLSGTDGSTLVIGTGGTLGTAAYTAASAYDVSGAASSAVSTHAALLTGVHGLAITAGKTLTVQDNVTISGPLGTGAYANISLYAPLASPTFTGTISESISANGDQIGIILDNPYADASASISVDLRRNGTAMSRLIGYLGQPGNNGGAFKIQVRDGNAGVMVTPISIVVNPTGGISIINLSTSTVTGLKLSGGIDVNGTTWTNSGGTWTIPEVHVDGILDMGGNVNMNGHGITGSVNLPDVYSTYTTDPHVAGQVWRSGNSLMISTG